MANIYIRLPKIICYYHRNYDVEHKLDNFTPIKFSPYTDHAVVMRGGLVVYTKSEKRRKNCYTHQQWKYILSGKKSDGSVKVTKRDPNTWPTYTEICTIEGVPLSKKSDNYDFLCISMPNTIIVGDKEIRTNPQYVLTPQATSILQDLLVRDFKRALVDWEIGTQDYCINSERVIRRGHLDTIERFLMRYDIPLPADGRERESLRRQLNRWLKGANVLEKAYRAYEIEFESSTDRTATVHVNKP